MTDFSTLISTALECTALPAGVFQLEIDGIMIFSLIVCALWGALVRAIIHAFHITFPYTVILMLSGMLIGVISKRTCQYLHPYTAVARIPAKILLFTFLPLLIFESAFSIPVHTFSRSLVQVWKRFENFLENSRLITFPADPAHGVPRHDLVHLYNLDRYRALLQGV